MSGKNAAVRDHKNRCERVYGLLGLAAKKGSVVSGWEACERALKNGAGGLLILAGNSAAGTKERFRQLAYAGGNGAVVFGFGAEIGRRIGKGERSVLIVTDLNIERGIRVLLGITDGDKTGV